MFGGMFYVKMTISEQLNLAYVNCSIYNVLTECYTKFIKNLDFDMHTKDRGSSNEKISYNGHFAGYDCFMYIWNGWTCSFCSVYERAGI